MVESDSDDDDKGHVWFPFIMATVMVVMIAVRVGYDEFQAPSCSQSKS